MKCTKQIFLEDIENHQMYVIRDEEVYRHLRFKKPGTNCMSFDIITWPGHLCYTGDMGTYVFKRLPDMFEFFRTKSNEAGEISINLDYWEEKCIAIDHRIGITEYSKDNVRTCITERLADGDVSPALRQAIENEILNNIPDNEFEARDMINNFEHEGFTFQDFWEANLSNYTYRYVWCCYALVWGIQRYDILKEEKLKVLELLDQ